MSRVFLFSKTVRIPVVADTEDEAREFLLENDEVFHNEVDQIVDALSSSDFADFDDVQEITAENLETEFPGWGELAPWGDDGYDTIAERLGMAETPDDPRDEGEEWCEPSHEDD